MIGETAVSKKLRLKLFVLVLAETLESGALLEEKNESRKSRKGSGRKAC